jgi:SAM-dependent methyltransferase
VLEAVGRHYQGQAGDEYFAWQQRIGALGAQLDRWKFEPHLKQSDTVVDFGCGAGELLAGLRVARRIGVEPNAPARELARANGLEMYESAAGLPDECADVVISNHALEHATQPFEELRDMVRALRPGGRLVLWLPLDDWRTQRNFKAPDIYHHLYTWTPLLLSNLLAEAGLECGTIRVVNHAWPKGTKYLHKLPRPLFDGISRAFAVLMRRRQLAAVARRV